MVWRPIPVDGQGEGGLTFAESDKYLRRAAVGPAVAVLAARGTTPAGKPTIFVDNPRLAFGQFLAMTSRPLPLGAEIHPTAVVSPEADIAPSARIGPYSVIERGVVIGERCRIYPYCYVGENCRLGEDTALYPHVVLYQDVRIGARSIVHSGTVIGAEGFGFTWTGDHHQKVPQVGGVLIGDDVEIGAITAIDRATAGDTMVGSGTKIDNLVQIAHNARLGQHIVMAGQSGIGGSARIGDRARIGGQVAVIDHMEVGADVSLAGRTGVTNNVTLPGTYFGLPARPLGEAMRTLALYTKLSDLFRRVRDLEKGGSG
jgi:UDP-3-O-[3-hydroxymyristoyl] glucosamine N-acyltransferase